MANTPGKSADNGVPDTATDFFAINPFISYTSRRSFEGSQVQIPSSSRRPSVLSGRWRDDMHKHVNMIEPANVFFIVFLLVFVFPSLTISVTLSAAEQAIG